MEKHLQYSLVANSMAAQAAGFGMLSVHRIPTAWNAGLFSIMLFVYSIPIVEEVKFDLETILNGNRILENIALKQILTVNESLQVVRFLKESRINYRSIFRIVTG